MNPTLFDSIVRNKAGGISYTRPPKEALAQYALTGTLGDTFYATAKDQLDTLKLLLGQVSDYRFVAQLAIYARKEGYMKDVPAFLVAWLAHVKSPYLDTAFREVINNGKMLRNVVQVCRSGTFGRKSIPRALRTLIKEWLVLSTDQLLINAIPGDKPSLKDIIRMLHPKTKNRARNSFFSYLLGKEGKEKSRPKVIADLEAFRAKIRAGEEIAELPAGIPFQLVDSLPLTTAHWTTFARTGGWHFTRMNLNTFARHGVFADVETTAAVAQRLSDPNLVGWANVFPYQLLAAYKNIGEEVPRVIRHALEQAMELAMKNVPEVPGRTVVLVDVSGSMSSAITGTHGDRKASSMRCVDVAALFATSFSAKNPSTVVVPFDTQVHGMITGKPVSVLKTAAQLAKYGGGGTEVAAAVAYLIGNDIRADNLIIVSDNESWAWSRGRAGWDSSLMKMWKGFQANNPGARLVCIDLTPEENVQAKDSPDVLNVGGFSDNVWLVVRDFLKRDLTPTHLVGIVESVEVE